MAYTRYSRECEWYIFRVDGAATRRQDERLAVWHADHRATGSEFSYSAVKDMMERSDFTAVPGRQARDDGLLRAAFADFLRDVDGEWDERA
jgi:hypothetical protein